MLEMTHYIDIRVNLFGENIFIMDIEKLAARFGINQPFLATDGAKLGVAYIEDNHDYKTINFTPLPLYNYRVLMRHDETESKDNMLKGYISEDKLLEIIKTLMENNINKGDNNDSRI